MLIAFTGKKGSGKSTASQYVRVQYGGTRINFKDALVEELKERMPDLLVALSKESGIDVDVLFQVKPPIMRALMQNYGTNVRRVDDPDYWVTRWSAAVAAATGTVIVDDVRFLNEAAAVKQLGGMIIRIIRSDVTHDDSHASETEMDLIDADAEISVVTGAIPALHQELDRIISAV